MKMKKFMALILAGAMVMGMAVSYTHLDVYKRQSWRSSLRMRRFWIWDVAPAGIPWCWRSRAAL